ncbi:NUDIX domain-containing protein [Metabacillus halosaccharovorans]|uniref:NUDIX hydrolase n=1 Tax=Metabacillus halosaccharovorans TaxID=930124 RepID=UPI00203A9044|nr:NUDIX domain-containing protein [Metabacillus halosaccharovorans]MCM3442189.1 NUDIX domain-containing protein [Metabacillus halosaccharovorans]
MSEQENLKIFDDDRNHIGIASRSDVHKLGLWHEVFHCWFIRNEEGVDYIYLQLRSKSKKDYPNLLDITAAGHLLADETVLDGVREIEEEIGVAVDFAELINLGEIRYCVTKEDFIDKELANVFLYKSEHDFDDFTLQVEEVAGIVRAKFTDFAQLWFGEKDEIEISGFEITDEGEKCSIRKHVSIDKFVPHEVSFYKEVISKLQEHCVGRIGG